MVDQGRWVCYPARGLARWWRVMRTRVWQLVALGWYIAVTLVGGILLGSWVDQQLGTAPTFLLLGLALGLLAAGFGVFQMLRDVVRNG